MPKISPHPHVAFRDGRPRFKPGPELRAAGYKDTDLRWPDPAPAKWRATDLVPGDRNAGRWFSRGETVDWSEAFVKSHKQAAKEAEAEKPAAMRAAPAGRKAAVYSLGDLFEDWKRSPKFNQPKDEAEQRRQRAAKVIYAPKSIVDFKQKLGIIERHDPSLWASPVDALDQPILFGLYEELVSAYGLSQARGSIATLSIALSWGRKRGKFSFASNQGVNPAKGLGMVTPPPRVRFGRRIEIETLVAVADHLKWPEMADMVILGVWTGQRQGDRLQMVDKGLLNKRRIFRQAKTGAIVSVMQAPELEQRMEASQKRRQGAGIVNPRVILDEQLWQPFPDDGDRYRKRYAELRAIAAKGIMDEAATEKLQARWRAEGRNSEPPVVWIVKPCPSLLGDPETGLQPLQEGDFRDTAVTWMALSGATIPEIISITGHTPESATRILKHYLARHPEMADSAIKKMVDWYDADGETEFGL
ncbi:hypothetical protein GGQ99_000994 [Aminobacter niigataensis]|uniref:Tyr recombinase domain-containing protein n=1 Tax=Aminobacter niigataensis TaxID=83265 RepID=A0ABR6KXS9_9HYPH|nr:hypothetical protein [Aminobacter niigataensis]MBB4649272.1 hypothetical protein [Aminobacter niigataensis]